MEFVHCMIMFLYNLLPTSQKNIDIVCNFSFSTYDLGTKYFEYIDGILHITRH